MSPKPMSARPAVSPRTCGVTQSSVHGGACPGLATWALISADGFSVDACEVCAQDWAPVDGYNGYVAVPSPFLAPSVPEVVDSGLFGDY